MRAHTPTQVTRLRELLLVTGTLLLIGACAYPAMQACVYLLPGIGL